MVKPVDDSTVKDKKSSGNTPFTAEDLRTIQRYFNDEIGKIKKDFHKEIAPIKKKTKERKLEQIRGQIQNL